MCEHKEVSTFSGIQFQYPRQIIQKGGRHPNIPALFKPGVVNISAPKNYDILLT